jgi:hypothetical protein
MGVAERNHGDTGAEIEICLALGRLEEGAFTFYKGQIGPRICRNKSVHRCLACCRQNQKSRQTGGGFVFSDSKASLTAVNSARAIELYADFVHHPLLFWGKSWQNPIIRWKRPALDGRALAGLFSDV